MDDRLFDARVNDTLTICERTCVPRFLGFLTELEASRADTFLRKQNAKFIFFGGFEQAERTMLACLPDWCYECDFPITSLTFIYREEDVLSHRDFLGSLMALGITRESVGDILVEKGRAVIFVSDDIAEFVLTQIEKVGRVGVTVSKGYSSPLPQHGTLAEFSDTVASLRLDGIVSVLAGVSRKTASEIIESGYVSINSVLCEKATRTVNAGERITIRSKGKFYINDVSSLSKKGRIILKYSKYVG